MKFKQFLVEPNGRKNGKKYRTVNLEVDIHQFFKRTANHYNISMATLIYNVLSQWQSDYQEEIKEDILKELKDS